MKLYDALQMDPSILKGKITACQTKKEKLYYWVAIALRSVLIVAFSIVFISALSGVFGSDNTPLAVALFCIMLGIRFVNFEYCIGDSLATLAMSLAILVLAATMAIIVPPILLIPLHFVAFFALLYITTQRPELGNGGLYSFAYVYLTGNPVIGEALVRRGMMALVGYGICGAILFAKHRHMHKETRFHHIIKKFDLSNLVHLWQIRMAIGVSIILTVGQIFGVERFMWMGFACASLLSEYPYSGNTTTHFWHRIVGAVVGSFAFFALYQLTPDSFHSFMGPLGGLCLGFCTDYRYKTAMNCFGALMLGAGIYGVQGAVVLRIVNTVLGVAFGLVFAAIFHKLVAVRFLPKPETKMQQQ